MVRQLGFGAGPVPVAMAGGALVAAAGYRGRLVEALREVQVIAEPLTLVAEPARGAVALALAEANGPSLVIGDFNDWFWVNSVRSALAARFPERTQLRTFPARFPLMRLDRIYGHDVRITASFTDRDACSISDHLPVIVDIA